MRFGRDVGDALNEAGGELVEARHLQAEGLPNVDINPCLDSGLLLGRQVDELSFVTWIEPRRFTNRGRRRPDSTTVRRAQLYCHGTDVAQASNPKHRQHRDTSVAAERLVALDPQSGGEVAGIAPTYVRLRHAARRPPADNCR